MSINTLIANPTIINDLSSIVVGNLNTVTTGSLVFNSVNLSALSCLYNLYVSTTPTKRICTIFLSNFTTNTTCTASPPIFAISVPIPGIDTACSIANNSVIVFHNYSTNIKYVGTAGITINNNQITLLFTLFGAIINIGDIIIIEDCSMSFGIID